MQDPNVLMWFTAFVKEHKHEPSLEDAFQAGRNFQRDRSPGVQEAKRVVASMRPLLEKWRS